MEYTMSTSDIMIVMAPFAIIWSVMAVGFLIVHIFEVKGK
jgi:hypothetical protein